MDIPSVRQDDGRAGLGQRAARGPCGCSDDLFLRGEAVRSRRCGWRSSVRADRLRAALTFQSPSPTDADPLSGKRISAIELTVDTCQRQVRFGAMALLPRFDRTVTRRLTSATPR